MLTTPTCALRPTPPVWRLNGTICFLSTTSFRYLIAFLRFMCLMAWAVSRVFYNHSCYPVTRHSTIPCNAPWCRNPWPYMLHTMHTLILWRYNNRCTYIYWYSLVPSNNAPFWPLRRNKQYKQYIINEIYHLSIEREDGHRSYLPRVKHQKVWSTCT